MGLRALVEDAVIRAASQYTGGIRPQGYNGNGIYLWFTTGPGSGKMDEASAAWAKIADQHRQLGATVDSAVRDTGTAWQGQAADQAHTAAAPLGSPAANAFADAATTCSEILAKQSRAFTTVRNAVQPVAAELPTVDAIQALTESDDTFDKRITDWTNNQSLNQRLFDDYGKTTNANLAAWQAVTFPTTTAQNAQVSVVDSAALPASPAVLSAPTPAFQHMAAATSAPLPSMTAHGTMSPSTSTQSPTPAPAAALPHFASPVTQTAGWAPPTIQQAATTVPSTQLPATSVPNANNGITTNAGAFGPIGSGSGYARISGGPVAVGSIRTGIDARSAVGNASSESLSAAAAAESEGASAQAATTASRAMANPPVGLYPPGMGSAAAANETDREHRSQYLVEVDSLFGDHRQVVPPVIGEQ